MNLQAITFLLALGPMPQCFNSHSKSLQHDQCNAGQLLWLMQQRNKRNNRANNDFKIPGKYDTIYPSLQAYTLHAARQLQLALRISLHIALQKLQLNNYPSMVALQPPQTCYCYIFTTLLQ